MDGLKSSPFIFTCSASSDKLYDKIKKNRGKNMRFLSTILTGALISESMFLVLMIYFYKREKEKVQLEKKRRAEDREYIDLFLENIEKRTKIYGLFREFEKILDGTCKDVI
jgi:hypothetical protein